MDLFSIGQSNKEERLCGFLVPLVSWWLNRVSQTGESLIEERFDAANDLFGRKRFGDVPDGPNLPATKNVRRESARGEHDDRQVLGFGIATQAGRESESVGRRGEGDVEQHEIHVTFGKQFLGRLRRGCFVGRVTLTAELERQDAPDIWLIVDDQNAAPHVRKSRAKRARNQD